MVPASFLPMVRRHVLWVTPVDPGWSVPFAGKVVRSAMGLALHEVACQWDCVSSCEQGPGCTWFDTFGAPGASTYALDASALDAPLGREHLAPVVLTTFQPETEGPLLTALRFALPQGLGQARTRFAILDEEHHDVDWDGVAARWATAEGIELVTPTLVKHPGWRRTPEPSMLLSSLAGKLVQAELDGVLPRVSLDLPASPGERRWLRFDHRSQATGHDYPVEGWVGSWQFQVDEVQALWLAVAETLGVGKGVARGQGVVRPVHAGGGEG